VKNKLKPTTINTVFGDTEIWRNNAVNYKMLQHTLPFLCEVTIRVPTHLWKYLIFFLLNSRPWKYLKTGQVLESPWISFHRSLKVLEFTKSNYAISANSLSNIWIGLECICFTYLEICKVFCLTQDLLIFVGLHRISYPAPAEIRPYFHIRPRPDMAAGYKAGFDHILLHLLHCLISLKNLYF